YYANMDQKDKGNIAYILICLALGLILFDMFFGKHSPDIVLAPSLLLGVFVGHLISRKESSNTKISLHRPPNQSGIVCQPNQSPVPCQPRSAVKIFGRGRLRLVISAAAIMAIVAVSFTHLGLFGTLIQAVLLAILLGLLKGIFGRGPPIPRKTFLQQVFNLFKIAAFLIICAPERSPNSRVKLETLNAFEKEKPTMLFIHGAGGSYQDFEEFIDTFNDSHNLVSFSYSQAQPFNNIVSSFLAQWKGFKNAHELSQDKKTIIITHSYGAAIARRAVLDDSSGLFCQDTFIFIAPVLGGSSLAMKVTLFPARIFLNSIVYFMMDALFGLNLDTGIALDPTGEIQRNLFSPSACEEFRDKTGSVFLHLARKDEHLPGHRNYLFLARLLMTKADHDGFEAMHNRGLAECDEYQWYEVPTDNPHDDILNEASLLDAVRRQINIDNNTSCEINRAPPAASGLHLVRNQSGTCPKGENVCGVKIAEHLRAAREVLKLLCLLSAFALAIYFAAHLVPVAHTSGVEFLGKSSVMLGLSGCLYYYAKPNSLGLLREEIPPEDVLSVSKKVKITSIIDEALWLAQGNDDIRDALEEISRARIYGCPLLNCNAAMRHNGEGADVYINASLLEGNKFRGQLLVALIYLAAASLGKSPEESERIALKCVVSYDGAFPEGTTVCSAEGSLAKQIAGSSPVKLSPCKRIYGLIKDDHFNFDPTQISFLRLYAMARTFDSCYLSCRGPAMLTLQASDRAAWESIYEPSINAFETKYGDSGLKNILGEIAERLGICQGSREYSRNYAVGYYFLRRWEIMACRTCVLSAAKHRVHKIGLAG
ncbi:MAG: alpha/beta hydrolase, partial [Candidatus Omnitrophica bacterium]|nr:alpha/beta hydrolase [Candidatus Omnitrophota bacterium]